MTNAFDVLIALIWAGSVVFVAYGAWRATVPFVERVVAMLEERQGGARPGLSTQLKRNEEPMPLDLQMMASRLAPSTELQWAADDAMGSMREVYQETGDWDKVRQWAMEQLPGANSVRRVS